MVVWLIGLYLYKVTKSMSVGSIISRQEGRGALGLSIQDELSRVSPVLTPGQLNNRGRVYGKLERRETFCAAIPGSSPSTLGDRDWLVWGVA